MGQEKMGMKDDAAVRAVGAYGGGIAATGNVCGILLGGIAMISSIYSRASLEEKEDPRIWAVSKKFMKEFEKMTKPFGGINCSDIARVNWSNPLAARKYYKDPDSNRKECIRLVGEASYVLGKLLEKEAERKG